MIINTYVFILIKHFILFMYLKGIHIYWKYIFRIHFGVKTTIFDDFEVFLLKNLQFLYNYFN